MNSYRADLHIHTCLSPCAELEMTPRNIVKEAKINGLDIIGICDHNSCENVPYVKKSAENEDIFVIGGIEVTTREEIHMLALFNDDETLFSMQDLIYNHLPGENDEYLYGNQVVVNENNEVVDVNLRLLIGATEITLEHVVKQIHDLNGVAIAAHVDRNHYSIFSQLGFIPPGLPIDAVGLSSKRAINEYRQESYTCVTFSDAHRLVDIGRRYTTLFLPKVNVEEIKKSFLEKGGRRVQI